MSDNCKIAEDVIAVIKAELATEQHKNVNLASEANTRIEDVSALEEENRSLKAELLVKSRALESMAAAATDSDRKYCHPDGHEFDPEKCYGCVSCWVNHFINKVESKRRDR